MQEGTMDFSAAKYAIVSPLATKLFQIDGVSRIFYGKDFVTVVKTEESDWAILKPLIFEAISNHFLSDKPLFTDQVENDDTKILDTDSETVVTIKEIIQARIRPFVQEDGGDIRFVSFNEETGLLILELRGSCSTCPSSSVTLKNGVENMITYYVPEVKTIEALSVESATD
jgi:Fe-S cluster biogenesis protein NfuA